MSNIIHPTAIIEEGAILGKNNQIGPYSIINSKVILGDNNILKSHVVLDGNTKIGNDNQFFSFASIGSVTQDKKYKGEDSLLIIGNNNVFREYTTANPGTFKGDATKIGDNCLFMVSSHVAHDCIIGNNVVVANCVALAGHVRVDDHVIIGGLSAVLQRTRIGAHAMIGGMSGVAEDVIPYGVVMGDRAHLAGINVVGLKRRNFTKESMQNIRGAFEKLFLEDGGTFSERLKTLQEEYSDSEEVMLMISFLLEENANAICKPKKTE
ncbi:MAG: acyl-ACP--UDP-N-acetylglucosamine O-acyltransferase [Pseudomonadota bacterium]